jgi:hypothetical protein
MYTTSLTRPSQPPLNDPFSPNGCSVVTAFKMASFRSRKIRDTTTLWSVIQTTLDELFQPLIGSTDIESVASNPILSPQTYMQAYTAVFDWTHSAGNRDERYTALYSRMASYLEEVCRAISSAFPSTVTNPPHAYMRLYEGYRTRLKIATHIFSVLDRDWVPEQIGGGQGWFRGGSDAILSIPRRPHLGSTEEGLIEEKRVMLQAQHNELVEHWSLSSDAGLNGAEFKQAILRAELGSGPQIYISTLAMGLRCWRLGVVLPLQQDPAGILSEQQVLGLEDRHLGAEIVQALKDIGATSVAPSPPISELDNPRDHEHDVVDTGPILRSAEPENAGVYIVRNMA